MFGHLAKNKAIHVGIKTEGHEEGSYLSDIEKAVKK